MADPLTPAQAVQVARQHLATATGAISHAIAAGMLAEVDRLGADRDFWKDQQRFAAKVAGDIADLDEQAPALRKILRGERARRRRAEDDRDRLAAVIEQVRALCEKPGITANSVLLALLPPATQPTEEEYRG